MSVLRWVLVSPFLAFGPLGVVAVVLGAAVVFWGTRPPR